MAHGGRAVARKGKAQCPSLTHLPSRAAQADQDSLGRSAGRPLARLLCGSGKGGVPSHQSREGLFLCSEQTNRTHAESKQQVEGNTNGEGKGPQRHLEAHTSSQLLRWLARLGLALKVSSSPLLSSPAWEVGQILPCTQTGPVAVRASLVLCLKRPLLRLVETGPGLPESP